jgi:hypothetical protein
MTTHATLTVSETTDVPLHRQVFQAIRLRVDYRAPISQAIQLGNYAWVNSDLLKPEIDPTTRSVPYIRYINVGLMQLPRDSETRIVLARIKACKVQPAGLRELLAFTPYFGEELLSPIVALGRPLLKDSAGQRSAVCLYGNSAEKYLGLNALQHGWNQRHRFLVILPTG